MNKPKQPKASTARAQALVLLNAVLGEGRTIDEAVANAPLSGEAADQRFAMLLALTTLQHLGQLDAAIANFLETPLPAKRLSISNALRLGAAQLLLLDTPAHAAVNETVDLVKKGKDAALSGLVNAVLQKMAAEKPALRPVTKNLPQWLRNRWEKQYGVEAVAEMCAIAAQRPPLDVNSSADMDGATRLDAQMIRFMGEHPPVEQLPGYAEGAFFIQDLAASYPVRLLGDVNQHQVLDVCAAPGGKTMQLIQRGAFVTAIDRAPARLKLVKENLKRMKMQANSIATDALEWQPSRLFDAILLDAPCTATGTWRRHPEVVQILKKEEIAELATLQRAMLARAWSWLKPGGKLVYCVCSLEPEEGESQAQWFRDSNADAVLLEIDAATGIPAECVKDGYMRTTPAMLVDKGGMDGFFAVGFQKQ